MYQVRRSIGKWIIFLILLTFAIAAIYPLFYMLMSSIKTEFGFMNDPIGLPESFYLDNYAALFNRFPLAQIFSNTLVCVLGAFVLSQSLTIPAAFAFAKLQFHNKNLLYTVMVALMAVPGITFIIPNYLLMSRLGLIDNYLSVILLWGILSVPGNVFLMTALMRGLPNEILEAVKIDGATYFQMIFRIVIPISTPGIVKRFVDTAPISAV
jgi:raffinose/stachyose/melibiose transport system permease protein